MCPVKVIPNHFGPLQLEFVRHYDPCSQYKLQYIGDHVFDRNNDDCHNQICTCNECATLTNFKETINILLLNVITKVLDKKNRLKKYVLFNSNTSRIFATRKPFANQNSEILSQTTRYTSFNLEFRTCNVKTTLLQSWLHIL